MQAYLLKWNLAKGLVAGSLLFSSAYAQTSPTYRVNTLAQLAAITIPTVSVEFSAIVKDVGLYTFDSSSSATTNASGVVIAPLVGSGRWLRITPSTLGINTTIDDLTNMLVISSPGSTGNSMLSIKGSSDALGIRTAFETTWNPGGIGETIGAKLTRSGNLSLYEYGSATVNTFLSGRTNPASYVNAVGGSFGIGTTAAAAKLAVNGGVHVGGDSDPGDNNLLVDGILTVPTVIGGTATTSDLTLQTTSGVGASGADMHFLVGNNGATEAITVLNSGNVGIGTVSPVSNLQIKSAANREIQIGGTAGIFSDATYFTDLTALSVAINFSRISDGGFTESVFGYTGDGGLSSLGLTARNDIKFVVGSVANRGMVIKESGNIGINTITPLAKLAVNGGVHVGGDSDPGDNNLLVDGIIAAGGSADASAIIDMTSTTQGLGLPRMTKAQRNAIGTPKNGLLIYQTDGTAGIKAYIAGGWFNLTATADP